MGEDRKERRITALDAQDELAEPLAKLTLLFDTMNKPAGTIELSKWGMDGLQTILGEAVDAIKAVYDAEIVTNPEEV